jgi:RND family efflux transporter MFP subunit
MTLFRRFRPRAPKAGWWKLPAGALALVALMAWSSGACRSRIEPGKVTVAPGEPLPPGAAWLEVAAEPVAPRIDVVGTVASAETIHLSARLSAYVKQVAVSAGDAVTRDQVLLTLDDRELREQLAAAEAQFKQAETEFQRTQRLFDTKAATEQALQGAEAAFDGARANLERIRVMQTYTKIVSPIDGIVTDRRLEVGDLVNPGQLLLSVYDPRQMRLEAAVPVRLIDKLGLNEDVPVALDYPPGTFRGRVTEIVSQIDPATRTRNVKILIEDAGRVLPGTFGRVWVREDPHQGVLVPAAAVYRSGQLELVKVRQGDRVVRRLVRTGPRTGDRVEILSGLNPGDIVLRNPAPEG